MDLIHTSSTATVRAIVEHHEAHHERSVKLTPELWGSVT